MGWGGGGGGGEKVWMNGWLDDLQLHIFSNSILVISG